MSREKGSGLAGLNITDCESYEKYEVPRPLLSVRLLDPLTDKGVELKARVNTGFAGHIIVPKEIYQKVCNLELPAEEFNTYLTVSGPVR